MARLELQQGGCVLVSLSEDRLASLQSETGIADFNGYRLTIFSSESASSIAFEGRRLGWGDCGNEFLWVE